MTAVTWNITKDGTPLGTVLAQTENEALGKATVKFGASRYPYEADKARKV